MPSFHKPFRMNQLIQNWYWCILRRNSFNWYWFLLRRKLYLSLQNQLNLSFKIKLNQRNQLTESDASVLDLTESDASVLDTELKGQLPYLPSQLQPIHNLLNSNPLKLHWALYSQLKLPLFQEQLPFPSLSCIHSFLALSLISYFYSIPVICLYFLHLALRSKSVLSFLSSVCLSFGAFRSVFPVVRFLYLSYLVLFQPTLVNGKFPTPRLSPMPSWQSRKGNPGIQLESSSKAEANTGI